MALVATGAHRVLVVSSSAAHVPTPPPHHEPLDHEVNLVSM
ncbi:hypothetical protein ACSVIA_20440 [Rhodococcus erythropolis]